jgi:DASH complex subunit ASK1
MQMPRTPGVSLQTPGAAKRSDWLFSGADGKARKGENMELQGERLGEEFTLGGRDEEGEQGDTGEADDEDTEHALLWAISPPKTIQFALPPGRLMQTPGMSSLHSHNPVFTFL